MEFHGISDGVPVPIEILLVHFVELHLHFNHSFQLLEVVLFFPAFGCDLLLPGEKLSWTSNLNGSTLSRSAPQFRRERKNMRTPVVKAFVNLG